MCTKCDSNVTCTSVCMIASQEISQNFKSSFSIVLSLPVMYPVHAAAKVWRIIEPKGYYLVQGVEEEGEFGSEDDFMSFSYFSPLLVQPSLASGGKRASECRGRISILPGVMPRIMPEARERERPRICVKRVRAFEFMGRGLHESRFWSFCHTHVYKKTFPNPPRGPSSPHPKTLHLAHACEDVDDDLSFQLRGTFFFLYCTYTRYTHRKPDANNE